MQYAFVSIASSQLKHLLQNDVKVTFAAIKYNHAYFKPSINDLQTSKRRLNYNITIF
jgi:hypothetical protein